MMERSPYFMKAFPLVRNPAGISVHRSENRIVVDVHCLTSHPGDDSLTTAYKVNLSSFLVLWKQVYPACVTWRFLWWYSFCISCSTLVALATYCPVIKLYSGPALVFGEIDPVNEFFPSSFSSVAPCSCKISIQR